MSSNRNNNKSIAEDTLKILEKGYFLNSEGAAIDIVEEQRAAESGTILYRPAESDALMGKQYADYEGDGQIYVTRESTLDAARRLAAEGYGDIALLNFASAKNPGGGFLGGSQAQEESIARASGLYPCLLRAGDYYVANRHEKSLFYTDHMIYSPRVPVFKLESGEAMPAPILATMITAPAVNRGAMKLKKERPAPDIELVMRRRIEKVLRIALEHGHRTIILGAWGCGVFQNEPNDIARFFKEVIADKFARSFENITFAIYAQKDRQNLDAFCKAFGFFVG